jgi:hypothetical protein
MNRGHINEGQLLLHYYQSNSEVSGHLAACPPCQREFEALVQLLRSIAAPAVPDPGPAYPNQVWSTLRPRLLEEPKRDRIWYLQPRAWALGGALAVLLIAAFLLGRYVRPNPHPTIAAQPPAKEVHERILLVAVGDHLEQSQMLLIELIHAGGGKEVDISQEQRRAGDLLAANRLYRQTAQQVGDKKTAQALDQLELMLLEIAHQPSTVSAANLKDIQDRIESEGLLFKVRVDVEQVQHQREINRKKLQSSNPRNSI